jgi:propane monooxygenase reductase subunit
VPALSHAEWEGETGLITDVVDRREPELAEVEAYLCGPPPMVDAAMELLLRRGVPEAHIHFDKFTTATTDSEESSRT